MDLRCFVNKNRKAKTFLAAFVILVVLSGCVPNDRSEPVETANPTATATAVTNTDKKVNKGSDKNIEPEIISVTISAAGDCTIGINYKMKYENSFDAVYDKNGKSYFFKNIYDIFSKDDFTIVNLEGPITNSKDRQKKLYNHIGKPEYIYILTEGSVEAVSFSNNHTYDYGQSGYEDTVELLSQAGISYAGDEVYGIYETKGIKIGFVSVNEHYDGSLVEVWLEDGIMQLREQGADLVFACIHWGRSADEGTPNVDKYQIELGDKCVDWGYDLVIGHHPHVLQSIKKYNDKYILYSLGNLCYGGSKNPRDKDCGIFQQTFTFIDGELQSDDNVRFIPCSISSVNWINNYQPTVAAGNEAKRIINKLNTYSAQYGVAFGEDGYPHGEPELTDQERSDAYYSIFTCSLKDNIPIKSVSHIGVDLTLLGLTDTSYLENVIKQWCDSNGYTVLFGSKKELVTAGYNKRAADGEAIIILFEVPKWSSDKVQCTVKRNITLLNYLREDYNSIYKNDKWVAKSDS